MAGEIPDLHAERRTGTGKGAARQARRDGMVPGIIYGGGDEPLPININKNALYKSLRAGRFLSTLFNLKVDGSEDVRVICRAVQRDVVRDEPTHVDFLRLRTTSRVNLFIPVQFINEEESPGLKRGGVLTVVRGEVELIVTADNIPEAIVADVSGLDVGDVITISKIDLPKGAQPRIADRDFVIANISAPSGLRSADEEEEEAEEFETPESVEEENPED
ncbi:MAG: 50S ribosomal protein L25/general stress protein Ctc [Rhodobacteraceae bacterium]|nr:50S ribosomal protein L25/general stress protein Ctc [Paracoccaceae bacterium]